MSVSRKEFLRNGIFAFGQEVVKSLNAAEVQAAKIPVVEYCYLVLDNSRCLAQKGGCFACIDHCPQDAIDIALGVGIAIDAGRCDGCGACAAVCPVQPSVIQMKLSEAESITP